MPPLELGMLNVWYSVAILEYLDTDFLGIRFFMDISVQISWA